MSWEGVSALLPFSRVATNHISLAWCELYVMLARLFRQFHVAVHDTSDADLEWVDAVLIVWVSDDAVFLQENNANVLKGSRAKISRPYCPGGIRDTIP